MRDLNPPLLTLKLTKPELQMKIRGGADAKVTREVELVTSHWPVPRTGPETLKLHLNGHKILINHGQVFRCRESQHSANDGNLADFVSVKSPYNLLSFHCRSLCVDFYFY